MKPERLTTLLLRELGPLCPPAREWLGDRTDMQKAWDECQVGEWMTWVLETLVDLEDTRLSLDSFGGFISEVSALMRDYRGLPAAERRLALPGSQAAEADLVREHFPTCPLLES
jgi:hypothetical protein